MYIEKSVTLYKATYIVRPKLYYLRNKSNYTYFKIISHIVDTVFFQQWFLYAIQCNIASWWYSNNDLIRSKWSWFFKTFVIHVLAPLRNYHDKNLTMSDDDPIKISYCWQPRTVIYFYTSTSTLFTLYTDELVKVKRNNPPTFLPINTS